jgi:hypothetical protein
MNVLVDYAISHNKQGMLDKIRLYCNQYYVFDIYNYIETKYNININNNMSAKKILNIIKSKEL